jgi:hypothetical protein
MRIDEGLLCRILAAIEAFSLDGPFDQPKIGGYSEDEVTEHLLYLHQLGYICGVDASSMDGKAFLLTGGLTPEGHKDLKRRSAGAPPQSPPISGFRG